MKGWVSGQAGETYQVLTTGDEHISLAGRRILFQWQGPALPGSSLEAGPEAALAALRQGEENAVKVLGRLPQLLRLGALRSGVTTTLAELASLLLSDPSDGWAKAGLLAELLLSPRFRHLGEKRFHLLAETEWRALCKEQRRKKREQKRRQSLRYWAGLLDSGKVPPVSLGGKNRLATQLLSLLVSQRRSAHWAPMAPWLGLSPQSESERQARLRAWLETLERWPGWPAIWLARGGVVAGFSAGVLAAAAALEGLPPATVGCGFPPGTHISIGQGKPQSKHLGKHPTFTIDNAATRDFDDAITLIEAGHDCARLILHIARLPLELDRQHPVFSEARQRMRSVFTVEGTHAMLPPVLSEGRFSLRQGLPRETLSFHLRITPDGTLLEGVEPGLVRVSKNLSYEQGAALLQEQSGSWGQLWDVCQQRRQSRLAKGAVESPRQGCWIDTRDPEALRVLPEDRSGPVHRMIEELAIAYNGAAGDYCLRHGLPAVYRVQAPSEGPYLAAALYRTRPGNHAGLACQHYVQTTAPLRRFLDLVMQRQILAHLLTGKPAFPDGRTLAAWARRANTLLPRQGQTERRIFEVWMNRYLAQHPDRTFEGVLRKKNAQGQGLVWLKDLNVGVRVEHLRQRQPGDKLTLRIIPTGDDGLAPKGVQA